MPRRAFVITFIALFSLGLLSVSPAFSLTDEEITALRLEISELRNQIQRAKDDIRFMSDVAKEDLRRADRTMDRLQEEMRAALQTARTDADRASRDAAWAKDFSNISLTALTITGIIVGIVTLFSLVFTWVYTRRIRDHTEEAKEFRNRTEGYMKEASQVIEEMESRKEDIDKDISELVVQAVEKIDEKRDQAAEFNRYLMEGSREFDQGRFEAALRAWEQALKIDDQSPIAWSNKGAALGELGRHEEALKAFEKAVELDPNDFDAWTGKGTALSRLGDYEEALEAFEKAIELDPKHARAWTGKGAALLSLGRHEEALSACEEAIKLDPEEEVAWANKACALSQLGQKSEMLDALKRAVELDPKNKEDAKTDPDFEPFRDDPAFRALVFGEEQGRGNRR